jgi:hypothetical protein
MMIINQLLLYYYIYISILFVNIYDVHGSPRKESPGLVDSLDGSPSAQGGKAATASTSVQRMSTVSWWSWLSWWINDTGDG